MMEKHSDVLLALRQWQEAETDNRDAAREAHLFLNKRDGQWEPHWWTANEKQPRYTFDMTSPIVDQIAGDMERMDFDVQVRPSGGEATKKDAALLDGMVRNIENLSNATDIYSLASRNMVISGIDGWRISQKFADDDSFSQDLVIEPIANFLDSVWFAPFTKPDASDCEACIVLQAMPKKTYRKRWPNGSCKSVDENRLSDAYYHKHEHVIVGQLYFYKEEPRELWLLNDGKVVDSTEIDPAIRDEMEPFIEKRRTRKKRTVYTRLFDGQEWLNKAQETVFNEIPVIPCIGNFNIFENKLLYRGVVEKLLDPQRVFNYTKSREIAEGALAPRKKWWMTLKQALGFEKQLATLNTNADPVQFYNPDPMAPGAPQQNGGAEINQGLASLSSNMIDILRQNAGLYAASIGDNPNLQSGVAIKRLQDRGEIGTVKYIKAMERAICRTGRILVDAIPVVYDTKRQVRILNEDGSFDMMHINDQVQDAQSGQWFKVNDVTKGKYDVTCVAGPSFKNRQDETVSAIVEMGTVDPSIVQMAGDVLFKNITAPGMDLVAERKRRQLFQQGIIPQSQYTEAEAQEAEMAAQQPQPPSPEELIAQAEIGKAEAEAGKAEAQGARVMVQAEADRREQDRKDFQAQLAAQNQRFEQVMKAQQENVRQLDTYASVFKTLLDAVGVDSFISPEAIATIRRQSGLVIDSQNQQ